VLNKLMIFLIPIFLSSCGGHWRPYFEHYSENGGDKNKNNIRDDIEDWIVKEHTDRPNRRNALLQYAFNFELLINSSTTKVYFDKSFDEMQRAYECIGLFEDREYDSPAKKIRELEIRYINNWERFLGYRNFLSRTPSTYDGVNYGTLQEVFEDTRLVCDFNIFNEKVFRKNMLKKYKGLK